MFGPENAPEGPEGVVIPEDVTLEGNAEEGSQEDSSFKITDGAEGDAAVVSTIEDATQVGGDGVTEETLAVKDDEASNDGDPYNKAA